MQTFLPYSSFKKTARVLDYKRLGKQRVEAYQILKALQQGPYKPLSDTRSAPLKGLAHQKTPWYNHPACRMWKGYESCLALYGLTICDEWIRRGYNDSLRPVFLKYVAENKRIKKPFWLGDDDFHLRHRSNLVRKNKEFYYPVFRVNSGLEYKWPV